MNGLWNPVIVHERFHRCLHARTELSAERDTMACLARDHDPRERGSGVCIGSAQITEPPSADTNSEIDWRSPTLYTRVNYGALCRCAILCQDQAATSSYLQFSCRAEGLVQRAHIEMATPKSPRMGAASSPPNEKPKALKCGPLSRRQPFCAR